MLAIITVRGTAAVKERETDDLSILHAYLDYLVSILLVMTLKMTIH